MSAGAAIADADDPIVAPSAAATALLAVDGGSGEATQILLDVPTCWSSMSSCSRPTKPRGLAREHPAQPMGVRLARAPRQTGFAFAPIVAGFSLPATSTLSCARTESA